MRDKSQQHGHPLGKPGRTGVYYHPNATLPSNVRTFRLTFGGIEEREKTAYQWLHLHATKGNGEAFHVWLLCSTYPSRILAAACETTARYILQEDEARPIEFRHRFTYEAVLPALGAWGYLIPHAVEDAPSEDDFSPRVEYLGHRYLLEGAEDSGSAIFPPETEVLELLPDVLIGTPHNTRQKDETRRYDGSDYELVRLTSDDIDEMVEAGINCLHVDAEQAGWIERRPVFYWGIGGSEICYPEHLYRSNYLGPGIFMDEPAVCTRDHVIRPRLAADAAFRKAITPQKALDEFRSYFHQAKYEGHATSLIKGLAARPDVDLGDTNFLQQNLFSWETMVSSAAYQLAEGEGSPPDAMVFEPPARVGTRRTLPEMNMTYGCQIPVDDPKNLAGILYSFLRGAARMANKGWGMSVYGQMDRADSFWYQTHAYDLGARLFFYWDSHQLACVPYGECLALSRHLKAHVESHPYRNMKELREAGEVAILLPPGYNLGHVHMGRGVLWGVGELNLERTNREGVRYRVMMSHFFTEIERCVRLGVAYDLLWDLEGLDLSGYREVVRIREDRKVEVSEGGETRVFDGARMPARPPGEPPRLTLELSADEGKAPLDIAARATIVPGSAAVYYTVGADAQGVYRNDRVPWELYGPGEEDYRFLNWEGVNPHLTEDGPLSIVEIHFRIEQPGDYRLRAAVVDMVGRTATVWKTITVA